MYVAESMLTMKMYHGTGELQIEREPVMVPNGCECQLIHPADNGKDKSIFFFS